MLSLGELYEAMEAEDGTLPFHGELPGDVEAGDGKLPSPGEMLVAMGPLLAYHCLLVGACSDGSYFFLLTPDELSQ